MTLPYSLNEYTYYNGCLRNYYEIIGFWVDMWNIKDKKKEKIKGVAEWMLSMKQIETMEKVKGIVIRRERQKSSDEDDNIPSYRVLFKINDGEKIWKSRTIRCHYYRDDWGGDANRCMACIKKCHGTNK